nr:hypothetical protein [Tanacetum cinerariifolium]
EERKNVEESRITPLPTPIRSLRIHSDLVSSDIEKLQELTDLQGCYGYLFEHLRAKFMLRKSFVTLVDHLYKAMADSLPTMFDKHIKEQVQQEERKNVEESRITPLPTPIRSLRIHSDLVSSDIKKLQELTGRYGYLFEHLRAKFMLRKSFVTLADHLYKAMADSLPTMVDKHIKEQVQQQVPEQNDPHGDAHPEGEKSEKRQKTSEYETYVYGESSSGHDNEHEQCPSTLGPEKIVLSLHKFPAVVFNDDDIEERTSRWMNKYVKKFNPYARYVFIRCSVIWERVHDFQLRIESYQQKVNLTAPTISFPEIKKHEMFSIIYEPVHGIIYKNSKKEKRVMRHSEIHKFCDATLNRVLEGLKSYNNDVMYGYIQKNLTKNEVEYLKLFEEEIEDRLKYRRQMRRWKSYVNERPLGLRREHPE